MNYNLELKAPYRVSMWSQDSDHSHWPITRSLHSHDYKFRLRFGYLIFKVFHHFILIMHIKLHELHIKLHEMHIKDTSWNI